MYFIICLNDMAGNILFKASIAVGGGERRAH